jgi:hypothetical protein
MWCPSCAAEYRAGFTHCPDCDVDLVDEPPRAASAGARRSGPRLVPVFSGELEDGESVQGLLQSRGLPSAIVEALDDDDVEVNVVVAAEQVPIALEILERSEWGSLLLQEDDPEFEEGVDVDEPNVIASGTAIGAGPAADLFRIPAGSSHGPIVEPEVWWARPSARIFFLLITVAAVAAAVAYLVAKNV